MKKLLLLTLITFTLHAHWTSHPVLDLFDEPTGEYYISNSDFTLFSVDIDMRASLKLDDINKNSTLLTFKGDNGETIQVECEVGYFTYIPNSSQLLLLLMECKTVRLAYFDTKYNRKVLTMDTVYFLDALYVMVGEGE